MKLIDSHAHIYLDKFKSDREKIIERALDKGVEKIYMPNIDNSTVEDMLLVADKYPDTCIPMMGLHPGSVKEDFEKELQKIEQYLDERQYAAIGEIGIDLYWDKTFKQQQTEALRVQITWAKERRLPIVLHCRDSFDKTYAEVKAGKNADLKGVFHCFTGTLEEAERVRELGFYIGIGGIVTFKNAGLDKVIPDLDMKTVVLETDSPYLAPVPHRGKRNESNYLFSIAAKVAELRGVEVESIGDTTTKNCERLFIPV